MDDGGQFGAGAPDPVSRGSFDADGELVRS